MYLSDVGGAGSARFSDGRCFWRCAVRSKEDETDSERQ